MREPKLGLVLSGGGLRAAFFHVGVLARMAELDLLRHVRVISTVSGGSTVGALYYLKLLFRPPGTGDADLVDELARSLRDAARSNLRARTFWNPFKTIDMLVRPGYSRTDRLGDVLDRRFYKPSWRRDVESRLFRVDKQIELRELRTTDSRLPALVMNATCLNTGHQWQFKPKGMGEPTPREREIDRNTVLAFGHFCDEDTGPGEQPITEAQRDFPLGLAVAASAGFPGLFSPLAITGLYKGTRVRLMDGGVHDNQGTKGLDGNGCTVCVLSDASGQMEDAAQPASFLAALLFRIIAIYGDRVREEQLTQIGWTENALIHLRHGISCEVLEPLDDEGDAVTTSHDEPDGELGMTGAREIHEDVQRRLARIRTDLDAFSDVETYSLMLNGYLLAKQQLVPPHLPGLLPDDSGRIPQRPGWPFAIAELVRQMSAPSERYARHLDVGSKLFFKTAALASDRVRLLMLALLTFGVLWICGRLASVDQQELDEPRLGVAIVAALAIPIAGARLVALIFGPQVIRTRLAEPRIAKVARWAPVAAFGVLGGLLFAVAVLHRGPIADWVGVGQPVWVAVLAGPLILSIALGPWLFAAALLLAGRIYLRQGSVDRLTSLGK